MTCTEIEELSGAYVLDALSPEESQAVEAHLGECPDCSQLIKELRSVVELLPLAVPQVDPSPALKERILAAVSDSAGVPVRPAPITPSALPVSRPVRRRPAWQNWGTQLIAAAAILFFLISGGLTAWNLSLQQQLHSISASAPVTYAIKSTTPSSSVSGQVTYLPQQHLTVITMRDLPQTQGTQVYQGWLLQGKQPVSIGLLNIRDGVATVDYSGDLRQFDAAAVSKEPGPSPSQGAPQGTIVAVGSLKSAT